VEPARGAGAAGSATARAHTPTPSKESLQSAAAHALFLLAHRVADQSGAGALFAAHSWYVAPPPPPAPVQVSAAEISAPQQPVAPPLPFTYMGSFTDGGAAPVFFLTQGDRVYDVRVGDTVDNTYTVDRLSNGQLVFTYKPLNIQQQLPTGVSP